jgi:hypothetical protein
VLSHGSHHPSAGYALGETSPRGGAEIPQNAEHAEEGAHYSASPKIAGTTSELKTETSPSPSRPRNPTSA